MVIKKSGHPTENTKQNRTHSPPIISCGKKDLELLIFINSLNGKRLNIKDYSRIKKTARTNIYNSLNRLKDKGLIERQLGNNKITENGIMYVQSVSKGSVQYLRQECPKNKLSTHWHKFTIQIKDNRNFIESKLNNLKLTKPIFHNRLKNLHQRILTLEDAKIIITHKSVKIHLLDYISDDTDEADLSCLTRTIEYVEQLKATGLDLESLSFEEGHWARVNSYLSEFLEKVDNRYYLELSDGSKFWIDHSNNKTEDETNNKLVRQRLDTSIDLLGTGKVDLTDINSLKEVSSNLVKLEMLKIERQLLFNNTTTINDNKSDYIN